MPSDVERRLREAKEAGGRGDREALMRALMDDDREVRMIAQVRLDALQRGEDLVAGILDDPFRLDLLTLRNGSPLECLSVTESAVVAPALRAGLNSSEYPSDRWKAAKELALLGDRRSVWRIIDLLSDEDDSVRGMAAESLATLGDAQAVPALISGGFSKEWPYGDPRILPAVISELLNRERASDSLQRHYDSTASDWLQRLYDSEEVWPLVDAAVEAGYLADHSSVAALIQSLTGGDPLEVVLFMSQQVISSSQERLVQRVVNTLTDRVARMEAGYARPEKVRTIAKVRAKLGETDVDELLNPDNDAHRRAGAAIDIGRTLFELRGDSFSGHVRYKRMLEALVRALGDTNDTVSWGAAFGLGESGDTRAVQPLISAVDFFEEDVSVAAIEGLANFDDPRVRPKLIEALEDPRPRVRAEAATKLAYYGEEWGMAGTSEATGPVLDYICGNSYQEDLIFQIDSKPAHEILVDVIGYVPYARLEIRVEVDDLVGDRSTILRGTLSNSGAGPAYAVNASLSVNGEDSKTIVASAKVSEGEAHSWELVQVIPPGTVRLSWHISFRDITGLVEASGFQDITVKGQGAVQPIIVHGDYLVGSVKQGDDGVALVKGGAAQSLDETAPIPGCVGLEPNCPACNQAIQTGWKVCPFCGAQLALLGAKCPNCSDPVEASWKVCPSCGTRLNR